MSRAIIVNKYILCLGHFVGMLFGKVALGKKDYHQATSWPGLPLQHGLSSATADDQIQP